MSGYKQICCNEMFKAVSSQSGKIPINLNLTQEEEYHLYMELVDSYDPETDILLDEIPSESIEFCPFCGKNISIFEEESHKWQRRDHICGSFLKWFGIAKDGRQAVAPTPMFKYEPAENQFYMHHRKGFGEGWIPVKYCIYCGEPLSEMVKKYGLSKFIAAKLDPSEWQGRYKLCCKEPKITDYSKFPGFYT